MGFLRQEYWSGLPFPSPGDLPDPDIELTSPTLHADSLPLSLLGSPSILLFKIWVLYLRVIFPQVSSLESSFLNRSFGLHFIFFSSPWWLRWWRVCLQCGRPGFDPWVGKIPWRREWQPTSVFLSGKFHGRRSLAGYSPQGRKESDTTERLSFPFLIFVTRKNGINDWRPHFWKSNCSCNIRSTLQEECREPEEKYLMATVCTSSVNSCNSSKWNKTKPLGS